VGGLPGSYSLVVSRPRGRKRLVGGIRDSPIGGRHVTASPLDDAAPRWLFGATLHEAATAPLRRDQPLGEADGLAGDDGDGLADALALPAAASARCTRSRASPCALA
jgi:hypothetical protein